jgi:hypothetical protein
MSGAADICLTKNLTTDFTVACNSITSPGTFVIQSTVSAGGGAGIFLGKTYYFPAGTIIRAFANATDDATNFHNRFSIIRMR